MPACRKAFRSCMDAWTHTHMPADTQTHVHTHTHTEVFIQEVKGGTYIWLSSGQISVLLYNGLESNVLLHHLTHSIHWTHQNLKHRQHIGIWNTGNTSESGTVATDWNLKHWQHIRISNTGKTSEYKTPWTHQDPKHTENIRIWNMHTGTKKCIIMFLWKYHFQATIRQIISPTNDDMNNLVYYLFHAWNSWIKISSF